MHMAGFSFWDRTPLKGKPSLLNGLLIHPTDFPMVTVQIVEAPAVHKAVILRLHGVLAAGSDRSVDHLIHLGPAVAQERKERFGEPWYLLSFSGAFCSQACHRFMLTLSPVHRTPALRSRCQAFSSGTWHSELLPIFRHPGRLPSRQKQWEQSATKHRICPLANRIVAHLDLRLRRVFPSNSPLLFAYHNGR
jgi:hypothetical protein